MTVSYTHLDVYKRQGYEYYNTLGYVPYDVNIPENAARTLEYAYDDWCIAQVAKKTGKNERRCDAGKGFAEL